MAPISIRLAACAAALFAFASSSACSPAPVVDDRVVTVHTPQACAVPPTAYALFYAFGDFQPTAAAPAYEGRFLRDVGAPLDALPPNTRQLVLDVSADELTFRGITLVPDQGPVDILAWPSGGECALTGTIGGETRRSSQLTVSGDFAVVTGGIEAGRVPESFVADLRTGRIERVASDLVVARERAAAAAFAGGVLVTGGARPSDGTFVDSAERLVLAGDRRAFDGVPIVLSTPRADHAAVTLASGEVLLVGGTGSSNNVLGSLEVVDPAAGRARTPGLASLAKPRRSAHAIRLANGEILVYGGVDAKNAAVGTLEWLVPDATRAARAPRDIDVGTDQAAVALPAGGALIVTSVPNALIGATVLHVTADGDLEQASPVGGDVPRVSLFAAANGAPILWTGARWLRWRPWEGTFGPLGLDAPGPALGAASAVGDPGLLVWTQEGRLVGMRVDVRGPYSTEPRPLLREDPGPLVPDRLVSSSAVSPLRFDPPTGLTLPAKASVFLADATYANVAVTVDASAGPPPLVVLRTESGVEVELGGAACPAPPQNPWTLTRRGARARFQSAGGDGASCDLPSIGSARVAVGLRGAGPSPTIVRELTLERR